MDHLEWTKEEGPGWRHPTGPEQCLPLELEEHHQELEDLLLGPEAEQALKQETGAQPGHGRSIKWVIVGETK